MGDITWYDAKVVHPAKNGWVVVITENNNKLGAVISTLYEDGYFNGRETPFNDVALWAYESEFEAVFNELRDGGDPNEADAAGCSAGVSEKVR